MAYTSRTTQNGQARALLKRTGSIQPAWLRLIRIKRIPNLNIRYFEISGSSPQELRSYIDKRGPIDQFGVRRDAYLSWNVRWDWPEKQGSRPALNKTNVVSEFTLTLPRWTRPGPVAPQFEVKWENFYRALLEHEMGHVLNVLRYSPRIAQRIRARAGTNSRTTVAEANEIGLTVLNTIRSSDRHYDLVTNHGKRQGAQFP